MGQPADTQLVQSKDDMRMSLPKEIQALEKKNKDHRPPDEKNLQTESEFIMTPYGMMNPMQAQMMMNPMAFMMMNQPMMQQMPMVMPQAPAKKGTTQKQATGLNQMPNAAMSQMMQQ